MAASHYERPLGIQEQEDQWSQVMVLGPIVAADLVDTVLWWPDRNAVIDDIWWWPSNDGSTAGSVRFLKAVGPIAGAGDASVGAAVAAGRTITGTSGFSATDATEATFAVDPFNRLEVLRGAANTGRREGLLVDEVSAVSGAPFFVAVRWRSVQR